jgi:hypothetical protein
VTNPTRPSCERPYDVTVTVTYEATIRATSKADAEAQVVMLSGAHPLLQTDVHVEVSRQVKSVCPKP